MYIAIKNLKNIYNKTKLKKSFDTEFYEYPYRYLIAVLYIISDLSNSI